MFDSFVIFLLVTGQTTDEQSAWTVSMVVLVRREGIINFHDESVIHVRQQVSKNYDKEKKKI